MSFVETINLANGAGTVINPATEDTQTDGSQKTQVLAENGESVSVQNPLQVDGDSIHAVDLDLTNSSIGTFDGVVGDLESLFDDYTNEIEDADATNPKTFTLRFKRPLASNKIGLGSLTGNFSNVKIELKDLAGTVRTTIDDSANNTDYTSNVYSFPTNVFIEAVITFATADAVKISGMYIPKSQAMNISAIDGYISETNSTATPLNAGVVFTGTMVDTLNYGMVVLSVKSDQVSATDGLSVQFSTDGTNWDHIDAFTIAAATGKTFSFQTAARFLRVVYTNGGVNQTYFRMQTTLKPVYVKPSSHRMADAVSGQDDGELVKAGITGERPDGVFGNVAVTNGNNLKISLEEYDPTFEGLPLPIVDPTLHISKGSVTGVTCVNKYGQAKDGVQILPTDIWDRADAAATQRIWLAPTAARIHTIVSTAAADDGTPEGAGAGAQAVRIWYLPDWDTKETFEDVILNGVAGVGMNNAAVIINRMKVIEVGTTYALNIGIITATAAVDATITSQINALNGQTKQAIYGVPSVQIAYATGYMVNSHDTANPATVTQVDFTLLANEHPTLDTTTFVDKGNIGTISSGTTTQYRPYNPYRAVPGPAILKVQATSTAADTEGVAEFDLILVDN